MTIEQRTLAGTAPSPPSAGPVNRRSRIVPWVGAIGLVAAGSGAVLAVPAAARVGIDDIYATDLLIGASFTVLGLVVARRRPENPIGWLFMAIGVIEAMASAADHLAIIGLADGRRPAWAVWAAWWAYWTTSFVVPSGLFLTLLVVFPTGRALSRRWGWVARAGLAFAAAFALSEVLFLPRMEVTTDIAINNPTNVANWPYAEGAWVVGLVILLAGVAGVVVRYRRSPGDERQQLRWFMFAVALSIGLLAFSVLVYVAVGAPTPEPAWFLAATILIPLVGIGVGVPIACGIAILRYRLWDLDVVIRKTVVVALVTGAITVLYIVIVGGIGAVVGTRLDTTISFAAAAVLAVAFQPIRQRANRLADRLVYGKRATPYEVLADFSERVGDAYAADDVLPRMAQILGQGTGAEVATVWLHVGGELVPAASWPTQRAATRVRVIGGALPDLGEPAFEVRHRGELLGVLSAAMPASDPDGSDEGAARSRSRRPGGARAPHRAADRGAPRIAAAPRRGPG